VFACVWLCSMMNNIPAVRGVVVHVLTVTTIIYYLITLAASDYCVKTANQLPVLTIMSLS